MEPMKSPLPAKEEEKETKVEIKLGFFTALRELLEGTKITRLEWEDEKTYGYMLDKIVCLHKEDGDHSWILSEADMKADDWVVVK